VVLVLDCKPICAQEENYYSMVAMIVGDDQANGGVQLANEYSFHPPAV
jgi:hypothetical protein